MTRYIVPLTTWVSTTVTVETDAADPHEIALLAEESVDVGSLCRRCASDVDMGDEWLAVVDESTGKPEVYEADN
ncbi:hypothetical protein [Streptomyces sp. NPDC058280]|uniref:hypothetical protein n=1 Tax=Streptomyces sp. NPDC058280 TaxID=3346419 RepID=UPI0036EF8C4B